VTEGKGLKSTKKDHGGNGRGDSFASERNPNQSKKKKELNPGGIRKEGRPRVKGNSNSSDNGGRVLKEAILL